MITVGDQFKSGDTVIELREVYSARSALPYGIKVLESDNDEGWEKGSTFRWGNPVEYGFEVL